MRAFNEELFRCTVQCVKLDNGNKGVQVNPETSMLMGTKINHHAKERQLKD